MPYSLYQAGRELLLPPTFLIIVLAVGAILVWRRPPSVARAGRLLVTVATAGLVIGGLPAFGKLLRSQLDRFPPIARPLSGARCGAIVVLGGGVYRNAAEFDRETVSPITLARLRYGVLLARESGVPLLLSGGRLGENRQSEAAVMQRVAAEEMGASARWLEPASRNTREQAAEVRRVLEPEGIGRICLVTDGLHMARAEPAFVAAGFAVEPAPVDVGEAEAVALNDFIPSAEGLSLTRGAAIEWFGRLVYRLLGAG